jgi:cellulose synthase/poly-beta-1,6-N-acetylglucosamine synthase-like glycosyltransferase
MDYVWLTIFWGAIAVQAYVLVGYAVLLLLIAPLVRRRPAERQLPRVSLIIPAHNEARVIRAKLENALSLDYPPDRLEIILASDGSSDETVEIAREFVSRGVQVLAFEKRRGKASVLNDAAASATGEYLCLCDANVIFAPDALQWLLGAFTDSRVGACTGTVRLASHDSNFGEGEAFYYRLERRLQCAESQVGSLIGVDGGMYAIRRDLFPVLPSDTILDDFVISMAVLNRGFRIVYEPRAVADESATPVAAQEWRRRVRLAAGATQTLKRGCWPPLRQPVHLWQYLSHKALRWLTPWLMLVVLVASAALWPYGAFYRFCLIAQVAFYASAWLAAHWLHFRGTRPGGIAFYFTMGNLAMAVGQIRGALNRQSVTWRQADRA